MTDVILDKSKMTEILEQVVEGEEIIFEAENVENDEGEEVEEIVEIIEEIVEEEEDNENEEEVKEQNKHREEEEDDGMMETEYLEEAGDDPGRGKQSTSSKDLDDYTKNNLSSKDNQLNSVRSISNGILNSDTQSILTYHVEEDWEDEDSEQTNHSRNYNQIVNPRADADYDHNSSNVDSDIQNEIVKNAENNLIYTVLNSRKPSNSIRTSQENRYQESSSYIKLERMDEEGIYYEAGDLDMLYVNNPSAEEVTSQQYEFTDTSVGNGQQNWEPEIGSAQVEQEDTNQEQIYLHEDEEGQLYFKDDTGTLQPVYLTEEGNYAIVGSGSDEQESQEIETPSMQEEKQDDENEEEVNDASQVDFTTRQSTGKKTALAPSSTMQDLENEDSTVTISLIISEDENGQKRTQVIIPTTENTKCDICHKTFKTSLQLLKHNRLKHAREEDITTRNFPCDLCPKRYPDQNSLARHRKTHTGNRYQCLECNKSFPTIATLRRHLSMHNPNSKPLPCIYCGRRFLEKDNLERHELSHLAGEKRNHSCDVCHKTFLNVSDLNIHLKTHDPDRKFDCQVCGREFNRLNNLQRHMMVHQQQGENQEVLACEVCGITYKFMSSLTRHMVTTHMNPEKLRQQAEEQRRKRENNYKRYLENRRLYETQKSGGYAKRAYYGSRSGDDQDDDEQV